MSRALPKWHSKFLRLNVEIGLFLQKFNGLRFFLSDTITFIKKLSIAKVYNAFLVITSFYITRWTQKPKVWGMPFSLSFEPTTACNLRCPECPSGLRAFTRPIGNLKADFFRTIIDQLHDRLMYLIFYFQGEPYINPSFLDMVRYAHEKKIYTITSTNGHFLTPENAEKTIRSGLDRLIISVDGTTQDTYEQYRIGGNLEQVLEGARTMVAMKKKFNSKTPHLIFQYLVVKPNEHQIPDIYRLAKEIGVDEVKLKSAQVYDYQNGNDLIPSIEKYARYKHAGDGKWTVKHELVNACWKMWHSCVITWDGVVVPCCFDKDATHQLGDLKQAGFKQIWHSDAYDQFRKKLLKGREEIDICTNCTEGCSVFY